MKTPSDVYIQWLQYCPSSRLPKLQNAWKSLVGGLSLTGTLKALCLEDHDGLSTEDVDILLSDGKKRTESGLEKYKRLDAEAAQYVESVIVERCNFSGEPPYVGWKGLGLALSEALDERDRLRQQVADLEKRFL